jgi:hypothetical protein
VQRLQIQLLVGFGGNKASRRPLHRLGYGVGISEIILVPLPKRLRICGRHLFHIVAQRGKFASDDKDSAKMTPQQKKNMPKEGEFDGHVA